MGRPKKYKDDDERRRARARREKERRAQESLEQREDRLRKMSQYVKMKRAAESEEQRFERLRKMSQNERTRRAAESEEQRLERLWRMSQNMRDRRAAESEVDKCSSQQKLQRTQDVSKVIVLSTNHVSVRHCIQLKNRNENLNFETRTNLKLLDLPKRREEELEEHKFCGNCKEVSAGYFTLSENTCKPLQLKDASACRSTPEVPVIEVKYSSGTEIEEVITTPDVDAFLDLWENFPDPRPQIGKKKFMGAKAVKVTVVDACPAYYLWEHLRGMLRDKDISLWVLKKVDFSSVKLVKLICKECNLQVWVDYETNMCIKRRPESRNPTVVDLENILLNMAYTKYKRKVLTFRESTDQSSHPLAI